ncbi:acyltransferase [Daejeonella sp.]|uniref:acyltransferase n=1 Tax=Daejeonella sp. TaxID=2805397 RepID=UPI0039836E4B
MTTVQTSDQISIKSRIKANPFLKRIALRMLAPKNEYRPRVWVKWVLNPLKHKRGKGSVIRNNTRTDLFPYNNFSIGEFAIIEDFTTINNAVGDVTIGDKTIVGIGSVIIGPVSIGNNVMIAQNIVISGLNHGYEDVNLPPSEQDVTCNPIIISDNVWIGANSVITAGVTLGKHCVIGAGSIVTKNVPAYSVAVGNPARVIKRYNSLNKIWEHQNQQNQPNA